MEISIHAKSSGSAPYEVKFLAEGNSLTVTCDCQAGSFGKLCKHKTELIAGDTTRLFDLRDAGKLSDAQKLLVRGEELLTIAAEIARTEKVIKQQTSLNKKAKKRLQSLLNEGVRLA